MKKPLLTILASLVLPHVSPAAILTLQQSLNTSGARSVTPFKIAGSTYLAVPQLAYDIPNTKANMNGGNADADVLIFKLKGNDFQIYQSLPGHGNEDTEFFKMGSQYYLATCSVDSGPKPPFNNFTYQKLYQWDGKFFHPIQQFYSYAAKGWTHFKINKDHYLGLANGVKLPNSDKSIDRRSVVYKWNGKTFSPYQYFDTDWGYQFSQFNIDKKIFLGLADHSKPSIVYQWNGNQFKPFQTFEKSGGRFFYPFDIKDQHFLALATIDKPSKIYQWKNNKFELFQALPNTGGRHFLHFKSKGKDYLLQILFITGDRSAPKTQQKSPIYEYKNNKFILVDTIATSGGVKAHLFKLKNQQYIALANSLSKAVRFKTPSKIYKVAE